MKRLRLFGREGGEGRIDLISHIDHLLRMTQLLIISTCANAYNVIKCILSM